MLRHRALAGRSVSAVASATSSRIGAAAVTSSIRRVVAPACSQHTSSTAQPISSSAGLAASSSQAVACSSSGSGAGGGGSSGSPIIADGALFQTTPVVAAKPVTPTTLRAGRGRPQRLAPLNIVSSAGGASGSMGAGSDAAAQAQQLKERLSRLAQYKRTPMPRHLTDPLPSASEIPSFMLELSKKLLWGTLRGSKVALQWTFEALKTLITNPAKAKQNTQEIWAMIKEEAHHYWLGSKLLVAEVRTSTALLTRIGRGEQLTRRERLQLKRTVGDLLRMVPFVIIVIIPFAELSLPILLKLFPNMLPSQFEKAEYRQETYRKSLNAKLELHGILQEVLQERVATRAVSSSSSSSGASDGASASAAASASSGGSLTSFEQLMGELEAVRTGKNLPAETVVKVAKLFKDEVTVDNLPRGQLAALSKFVGLSPFAPEPILRYQLRTKMKAIREDDRDLLEEGTDTLTRAELQAACESRGMRAAGLEESDLRRQLNEWLDLSLKQRVPLTLLLLSRAFTIAAYEAAAPSAAAPAAAAAAPSAAGAAEPQLRSASATVLSAAGQAAGNLRPAVPSTPQQLHQLQRDAVKAAANAIAGAAAATAPSMPAEPAVSAGAAKGLQESISTLDANVLNEVLLAAHAAGEAQAAQASADAASSSAAAAAGAVLPSGASPSAVGAAASAQPAAPITTTTGVGSSGASVKAAVMAMKLEQLEFQNELIRAEREAMESLTESQRAESEAASKRLAAEAAQQDASKNQGEVDSLVAEASAAARLWQEKQAVAAAKQDAVLRMRARDAAVAAGAAKPPVPAAQDVEKEKEGAEALFSIAADATMARERELLANIKRAAKQLSAAEMMARGRIGVVDAAAPTGAADGASSAASSEGAGAAYLRSKLDSMLAGIEGEMERLRGDMDLKKALLKVDSNRDGQVTASEIEAALKTIVRSAQTDAAAAALIRLLDSDRDGSVNVDSLNRFLSEFAERNARKEAKEAKDKEKAEKEAVSTPKGTPTAAAVSKEAASSFSEEESDHDDHDHHGSSSKGRKQPPKELK